MATARETREHEHHQSLHEWLLFSVRPRPPMPPANPPKREWNGNGNPGDRNFGGRRRRFKRIWRINGPVPSITTPPGGIQRAPSFAEACPIAWGPQSNQSKQTLTSFVITCRVNIRRKDLVPAGRRVLPAKAANDGSTAKRPNTTMRKAGASAEQRGQWGRRCRHSVNETKPCYWS